MPHIPHSRVFQWRRIPSLSSSTCPSVHLLGIKWAVRFTYSSSVSFCDITEWSSIMPYPIMSSCRCRKKRQELLISLWNRSTCVWCTLEDRQLNGYGKSHIIDHSECYLILSTREALALAYLKHGRDWNGLEVSALAASTRLPFLTRTAR